MMSSFVSRALLLVVLSLWCVKGEECEKPRKCEVRARLDSGWVCGQLRVSESKYGYASFKGVPYGKPPLGDRRFKELEPVDPWDGHRDATQESPVCPQKELIYGRMTRHLNGMSEDCIYANVHTPYNVAPAAPDYTFDPSPATYRPILVMIHGGGFQVGSGLTDIHGPDYLISKDVIVITFNYRINVFGFLSMKTKEIPGNQGLRDQLTLLRWVQRNAHAFGGNPKDVTLMGQSAGASCAHILSLSKAAEGLFRRVILLSGTAIPNYFTASPQFASDVAQRFLSYANINATDPEKVHDKLLKLSLVKLMQANAMVQNDFGLTSFVPVVENEYPGVTRILDAEPLELIADGRGIQYPMLIGFTDQETEFFRWITHNMNIVKRIQKHPELMLSPRIVYNRPKEEHIVALHELERRYFNETPTLDEYLVMVADSYFKYPAIKLATWRALADSRVFLYQFSYRSQKSVIKEALWTDYTGSAHVEDLTYIFRVHSILGEYIPNYDNEDDLVKEQMISFITDFMRCSAPVCYSNRTYWPPVSRNNLQYLNIDKFKADQVKKLSPSQLDMLQLFDKIDVECRQTEEKLKKKYRKCICTDGD